MITGAAVQTGPIRCGLRRRWPWKASGTAISKTRVSEPIRIGLLEHCGTGNLGDDATVAAVLQQIRSRWPHASVVGLSLDPSDSERRHGIPSFSIRRSVFPFEREWRSDLGEAEGGAATVKYKLKQLLKGCGIFGIVKAVYIVMLKRPAQFVQEIMFLARSLAVAHKLDILIICGGGQLLDWGGPWAFPYTLFKWSVLAKLTGAKCYFLNNGAGPLDHPLSRWFIRRALLLADYVSFRDVKSSRLIREIGVKDRDRVVADCAWGLDVRNLDTNVRRARNCGGLTVGIAPMAYCDPTRHWVHDEMSYQRLIRKMAEFCKNLVWEGHQLRLFSSDIWFDSKAIADLEDILRNELAADMTDLVTREPVSNINDMLGQLSQLDCYVTCRFHGVIFAYLLNVPALAMAPHPKVTTLMEDCGLSEYCVDIEDCDLERLITRFERLVANIDDVKGRIRRKVACYQDQLAAQFDDLFPPEPNGGAVSGDTPRLGS